MARFDKTYRFILIHDEMNMHERGIGVALALMHTQDCSYSVDRRRIVHLSHMPRVSCFPIVSTVNFGAGTCVSMSCGQGLISMKAKSGIAVVLRGE
jgi:hypothetical protein